MTAVAKIQIRSAAAGQLSVKRMQNITITYKIEMFPRNGWDQYLKAFNVHDCNRSTDDYPLWRRIKSSRVEIFVSWPRLSSNNPVKWSIRLDPVTKNEETSKVMKAILKDLYVFGEYSLEEDKNV